MMIRERIATICRSARHVHALVASSWSADRVSETQQRDRAGDLRAVGGRAEDVR